MPGRFKSYEEFWPYYLDEHSLPLNRALHYVGTLAALGCLCAWALGLGSRFGALAPLLGYGLAWVGHGLVERNRPATFQHPIWSLVSDLRMLLLALAGRLSSELERCSTGGDGP